MRFLKKSMFGLAIVLEVLFSAIGNTQVFAAPTIEETILSQINEVRAKQGLSALTLSKGMTRSASIRAEESSYFFSHQRPDGSDWYTVDGKSLGENLYKGDKDYNPSEWVVSSWVASPSHYEVLTLDYVSQAGIGVYIENGTYYVTLEVA